MFRFLNTVPTQHTYLMLIKENNKNITDTILFNMKKKKKNRTKSILRRNSIQNEI